MGATVETKSIGGAIGAPPSSGWCTYTAIPHDAGVPVIGLPFFLQENAVHKLWFPGIQTGQKWDVNRRLPNGLSSPTVEKTY